jgi:hypothetical protein
MERVSLFGLVLGDVAGLYGVGEEEGKELVAKQPPPVLRFFIRHTATIV